MYDERLDEGACMGDHASKRHHMCVRQDIVSSLNQTHTKDCRRSIMALFGASDAPTASTSRLSIDTRTDRPTVLFDNHSSNTIAKRFIME